MRNIFRQEVKCLLNFFDLSSKCSLAGCGSVWLERSVRDAEAVGSNPTIPMTFIYREARGGDLFV